MVAHSSTDMVPALGKKLNKSKDMTWQDFEYLVHRPDLVECETLLTSRGSFPKNRRASAQEKKHMIRFVTSVIPWSCKQDTIHFRMWQTLLAG